ncbi:hypothetical protein VTO73DRAFT_4437 [Trametes versicolor]
MPAPQGDLWPDPSIRYNTRHNSPELDSDSSGTKRINQTPQAAHDATEPGTLNVGPLVFDSARCPRSSQGKDGEISTTGCCRKADLIDVHQRQHRAAPAASL